MVSSLPDRQVARIALMLLKHGARFSNTYTHSRTWGFAGWMMHADPAEIYIYKLNEWVDGTIDARSQLGLAIRKS